MSDSINYRYCETDVVADTLKKGTNLRVGDRHGDVSVTLSSTKLKRFFISEQNWK